MSRTRSLTVLVALAVGLGLASQLVLHAGQPAAPGKTIDVKGVVEPFEQADLYAGVIGEVSVWNFDVGDRVKKGDQLAQLYVPDLEQELVRKKALVSQAQVGVRLAKEAELAAKAALQKTNAHIEEAEAGVALAEADRERTKRNLELAQVRMPFDGVVIRRMATVGTRVGPTTGNQANPLFVVARTEIVRVVVAVPEADALAVVPGTRATVRLPALKGMEFAGEVALTAAAIDPKTATMRVEIHLKNRAHKLLPGMSANVELLLPAEEPKKK